MLLLAGHFSFAFAVAMALEVGKPKVLCSLLMHIVVTWT